MDVHCTTCSEPWDVHHLWHDAIHETGLSPDEADAWSRLPQKEKLTPRYRELFLAAGWQFGNSVINVTRCPSCPKDANPDLDRLSTKAVLEELLGDDEDGLAGTYSDYNL